MRRTGIKQFFVAVEKEEWKFDTLCDMYDTLTITQAVIFCNTKKKVRAVRACVIAARASCWCIPRGIRRAEYGVFKCYCAVARASRSGQFACTIYYASFYFLPLAFPLVPPRPSTCRLIG